MAKINLLKRISAFGVAAVMAAAMTPAVAMADDGEITHSLDNTVIVEWSVDGVDDALECEVDLDDLWDDLYGEDFEDEEGQSTQSNMGALYKKGANAFTVLGSNKYVPLNEVIEAAAVTKDEIEYRATSAWNNDSDYIVFDAWNVNRDSVTGDVISQVLATYTKYYGTQPQDGYTRYKLNNLNNFCDQTTAQNLVVDEDDEDGGNPPEYADGAILALNSMTQSISGTDTAQATLDSIDFTSDDVTYNSPRLMWGHEDGNTAGNRFPSNIDVIRIVDVA